MNKQLDLFKTVDGILCLQIQESKDIRVERFTIDELVEGIKRENWQKGCYLQQWFENYYNKYGEIENREEV